METIKLQHNNEIYLERKKNWKLMMTINTVNKYLENLEKGEYKIFYALPRTIGVTLDGSFSSDFKIYQPHIVPLYFAIKKETYDTYYVQVGIIDDHEGGLVLENKIIENLINYSSDTPFRELDDLDEINNDFIYYNTRSEAWKEFVRIISNKNKIIEETKNGLDSMYTLIKSIEKTNPELYI